MELIDVAMLFGQSNRHELVVNNAQRAIVKSKINVFGDVILYYRGGFDDFED